ncbi:MAG TPA: hypothetical protein VF042_13375 [Gemmatimonadaceae bacterium]
MSDRRPPTIAQVIREQFKATGLSLRIYLMIAAGLLLVATFLAITDFINGRGGVEFAPELSMIPAFAGALLPIAVWHRDRPFGSRFLWTLPFDRTRHTLAKMLAGWMWLMIAGATFLVWLLILALITKGNIAGDEVVKLLPSTVIPDPVTLDPSLVRTMTWIPPKALWLVPFTSATATYLLVTAITLGFKHPFRWILGTVALVYLMAAIGHGLAADAFWPRLGRITNTLMEGRYGVDAVLSARTESLHTQVVLSNAERIGVWRALPKISDWLIATLLWTSIGITGLIAALYRNREQR